MSKIKNKAAKDILLKQLKRLEEVSEKAVKPTPQEKKTGDVLWDHLSVALGEGEAKRICEDVAMVLANHHLVHSPDLCKALFYHMISVTEDWNSV